MNALVRIGHCLWFHRFECSQQESPWHGDRALSYRRRLSLQTTGKMSIQHIWHTHTHNFRSTCLHMTMHVFCYEFGSMGYTIQVYYAKCTLPHSNNWNLYFKLAIVWSSSESEPLTDSSDYSIPCYVSKFEWIKRKTRKVSIFIIHVFKLILSFYFSFNHLFNTFTKKKKTFFFYTIRKCYVDKKKLIKWI